MHRNWIWHWNFVSLSQNGQLRCFVWHQWTEENYDGKKCVWGVCRISAAIAGDLWSPFSIANRWYFSTLGHSMLLLLHVPGTLYVYIVQQRCSLVISIRYSRAPNYSIRSKQRILMFRFPLDNRCVRGKHQSLPLPIRLRVLKCAESFRQIRTDVTIMSLWRRVTWMNT